MKTIWILNHHAVTPYIGGGTRHYDFSKELVKRGYTVYIFASSFIHNKYINILDKNEKMREEQIEGINWVWLNTRPYKGNGIDRILGMWDYFFKIIKYYRRYPKPDVVIGSAVHLLACIAGYRIAKKLKVKFISEIRDLWPETLIQLGNIKRNSMIAKIMFMLEYYVYKKSDKIIVTAPGMIEYIIKKGIKSDRITYINNGVDTHSFDLNKDQYQLTDTTIHFDSHKFNVVYVGAFGKANALDTIINAGKLVHNFNDKEIKFTLIGDGPIKGEIINKIESNQLNFNIFDSVSKFYIPIILENADCLIFSAIDSQLYKYGISANKLFDYMCSGKPIIFAINSYNDIVREAGAGITVEPENEAEMADAILKLYNMSKEEREAMGLNGRRFIENNYDIPILVDKLEEVMNE